MKTEGKKKITRKAKEIGKEATPPFRASPLDRWEKAASSHPEVIALISLSVAGLLLYFNSIHNEFVFDDIPLILENRWIRSLMNLPHMLGINSWFLHYRPIREISYMIDYQFTGLNPVGYHFSNIFYHILISYLVFLIVSSISTDRKVAWVAVFLFIAHPIQTETVAYLSGRRDLLTTLFFLMGFYFFLKQRQRPSKTYLFLIFLSYILSLFSKEMGVTFPALLFLYDLLRTPPHEEIEGKAFSHSLQRFFSKIKEVLKRDWPFYLALFLIAILFTVYKVVFKNPSRQEGFYGGAMSSNFLTVFNIWVFYIQMLILPLSLNAAHSFPISRSIFEVRTFLSICILLAILVLLIKSVRKRGIYSFGGFWFFVTLLPVSHIFPHHELLAEHYLYLPSFGFSLMAGLLFSDLVRKNRWKIFVFLSLAGLLLFYSSQTIFRNRDWRNEFTLWTDSVKKSPDNRRAQMNLVTAYNRRGLYDKAITLSLELLKREPLDHEIYDNLGVSYMLKGEYDAAIEKFKTSIQIKNNNPKAYNNLGVLYLGKKDFDQAILEFKKAISYHPRYPEAINNLAKAFAMQGLIDEAIEEEGKAIQFDPVMPEYHFNMGKFYENKGRVNDAVWEYQEALRLNDNFFEAHYYLGALYTKINYSHEAILELQKALQADPQSGKTYFLLGVNFMKMRDGQKAIWNLERALDLATNEKDRKGIESVLNKLRSISR